MATTANTALDLSHILISLSNPDAQASVLPAPSHGPGLALRVVYVIVAVAVFIYLRVFHFVLSQLRFYDKQITHTCERCHVFASSLPRHCCPSTRTARDPSNLRPFLGGGSASTGGIRLVASRPSHV